MLLLVLLGSDLTGTNLGEDTSNILLHIRDAGRVVKLAGGHLKTEVEQLGAALLQLLLKLLVVELPDLCGLH